MLSREDRLLNSLRSRPQIQTPIATDMFIPNYSGLRNPNERTWDFTIINPNAVWTKDSHVFIAFTRQPILITRIRVELDTNAFEVLGDLMAADTFIAMANSAVISAFDTTSGIRNTVLSALVAINRAIYLSFDALPNAAIVQMHVHIEYTLT